MLGERELRRLSQKLGGLTPPLEVIVHPSEGAAELTAGFEKLAGALRGAAGGGVAVKRGNGEGLPAAPALSLCRPGRGVIHYLALPEGPEEAPFVEALVQFASSAGEAGPDGVASFASRFARPVELTVFIAYSCPHCPGAVRAANTLALGSGQVTTLVVDAQRFAALAERIKVRSVPTTVIDGELTFGGVVSARELADRVLSRGTAGYNDSILLSHVESARFDHAVDFVFKPGGAESFLSLWKRSTTSSRMGLLMVVERLLGRDSTVLNGIVSGLLPVLRSDDAALRGDTADLLGQIGHPDAREALRALLGDPNPDVAEIAAEALGDDL